MPQPFVNFSLQSLPLAKIVHPSRGHWLPCGYSPADPKCVARGLITARFPDSRAFTPLPGSPRDYELPFLTRPKPLHSQLLWTTSGGITPSHRLHPLRSFTPLANPFAPT
jgi:hypothetical protein